MEKYLVAFTVKSKELFEEKVGKIKDWDGKGPLYFNGRYYGELSGDISKAKLYSKRSDAEDRLRSVINYRMNWGNPFQQAFVQRVKQAIKVEENVTVKDVDKTIEEIKFQREVWKAQKENQIK